MLNNKRKNNIFLPVLLGVLVAFAVALEVAIFWFFFKEINSLSSGMQDVSEELLVLEEDLVETRRLVSDLFDSNQEIRDYLGLIQEEKRVTEEALKNLRSDLEDQEALEESQVLSNIVRAWEPRIVKINCVLHDDDGDKITSTGSGVSVLIEGRLNFITNKHQVEKENAVLDGCEVYMPDKDRTFDIDDDDVVFSSDRDIAYLPYEGSVLGLVPDQDQKACSDKPDIGDRIITLGYPKVGSDDSITVTEGIISGLERNYYVTSAKIERGNSGGAAVLVESGCFLGLPTIVVVGRIESLARILPVGSLTKTDF